MNNATFSGKMTRDFSVVKAGEKWVAKGTMTVSRGLFGDKLEEAKAKGFATADFPQIEIWGSEKGVKRISDSVKKGDAILVKGSISSGKYTKDEKTIYTEVIVVSPQDVEFTYKEKVEEEI